jgi:hypothetical protein
MMKHKLEPQEALAGPMYVVAALLIVIPVVDFVLGVPEVNLSSIQWRFATVGLLSGYTLTPVLGLSLAFVSSSVLQHHRLQRVLVFLCLTSGFLLLIVCGSFLLDAMQLRASLPAGERPGFNSAWRRAILKHFFSAVALLYLGWGARRMIPMARKRKTPPQVHIIPK